MNTAPRGGPDSEAAIDAERLVSRTFPDRRTAERRVLDTRIDVDLTNPNLEADKRHRERRQFADKPDAPSAFAGL